MAGNKINKIRTKTDIYKIYTHYNFISSRFCSCTKFAKKISEPLAKIQALEQCEGVYDPKLVVKIEKALNVKFTRSWKK